MTKREKNTAVRILENYLSGKHTPDRQKIVQEWLASGRFEEEKDAALKEIFDRQVGYDPAPGDWSYQMLADLHRRLGIRREVYVVPRTTAKRRIPFYRSGPFLRVAALFIPVALVIGAWLWTQDTQSRSAAPLVALVTTSVPDTLGAQNRTSLPDGSCILVRPGSRITYAGDFDRGGKRSVNLEGEAYFSVAKDSVRSFVVGAGNLNINVLGTTFDVQSVPGEPFTTITLFAGRIMVDGMRCDGAKEVVMTAGQRMIYDNVTCEYRIEQTSDMLPEWIAQRLTFDHTPLDTIFGRIEWYYGVKIERDGFTKDYRYTFRLSGREDLAMVMALMKDLTPNFSYGIDGGTVRVTKRIDDK